jgi:hypothetical protein
MGAAAAGPIAVVGRQCMDMQWSLEGVQPLQLQLRSWFLMGSCQLCSPAVLQYRLAV